MSEENKFEPIMTQEAFDAKISERLKRAEEKYASKYTDYEDIKKKNTDYEAQIQSITKQLNEANEKVKNHDSIVSELNSKISAYETNSVKMRIAKEYGIPMELADRLTGDKEEDIKKDAETFRTLMGTSRTQPLASEAEQGKGSDEDRRLKEMLRKLNK